MVALPLINSDHISVKTKQVSKMSLLEQFWPQAKNLVLASKCLKIYKHKILQTSHPHCRGLKWVKLGSLNNISEFLVCTPSLAL